MNVLAKFTYFFAAFPYIFSYLGFGGVQPYAIFSAFLFLLIKARSGINLNNRTYLFLFFSLFLFLLGSILFIEDLIPIGLLISTLSPLILILFHNNASSYLSTKFLENILLVYIASAIFAFFFPELFISFTKLFTINYRYDLVLEGARGTGTILYGPEPGLSAGVVCLIFFGWLLHRDPTKVFKNLFIILGAIFTVYETKSGTGYVLILAALGYAFFIQSTNFSMKVFYYLLSFLFLSILYVYLDFILTLTNQGVRVLEILVSGNIPETSSAAVRINSTVVALYEVIEYPFGVVEKILFGVGTILPLDPGFPTPLGRYAYTFGILGLIFFMLLLISLDCDKYIRYLLIVCFLIPYPLSLPTFMFLLSRKKE